MVLTWPLKVLEEKSRIDVRSFNTKPILACVLYVCNGSAGIHRRLRGEPSGLMDLQNDGLIIHGVPDDGVLGRLCLLVVRKGHSCRVYREIPHIAFTAYFGACSIPRTSCSKAELLTWLRSGYRYTG